MGEAGHKFYPPAPARAAAPPPAVPAPPIDAPLARDVGCIQCGYNLRGLSPLNACPECATSVAASLREDRLAHADPAWLRRLRGGMALYAWTILAFTLYGILLGVMAICAPAVMYFRMGLAGRGAELLVTFLVSLAVWRLTAPEPGRVEPAGRVTLRYGLRFCSAAYAAADLLTRFALAAGMYRWAPLYFAISALLYVASLALTFTYLRRLAGRVPAPRLALWLRRGLWVAASGYFLYDLLPQLADFLYLFDFTYRASAVVYFWRRIGLWAFVLPMLGLCVGVLRLRRSIAPRRVA